MSDEPGDWESALISAGYVDGRGANRASWRRLAQEVGVHQTTLKYMRTGERDTDQATVDAVAGALRLDPRTVAEWVGRARSERAPYVPPSDAHLLDREEREAVNRLITLLAKPKKRGSGDAGNAEAQKTPNPAPAPGDAPDMLDVRDEAIRIATQDDQTLAARHEREHGKIKTTDDAQKLAGEENQDDGGEDPA